MSTATYDVAIIGDYNIGGDAWSSRILLEEMGLRVIAQWSGDGSLAELEATPKAASQASRVDARARSGRRFRLAGRPFENRRSAQATTRPSGAPAIVSPSASMARPWQSSEPPASSHRPS